MPKIITYKCPICSCIFEDYKSNNRKYCSRKCQEKGKTLFWSKENAPKWTARIKKVCEVCAKRFTVHRIYKAQRFCSYKCRAKWTNSLPSDKQPNWQGGVSKLPYPFSFTKQLKETIRFRENFECFNCGENEDELGYILQCHHIDYNKSNLDKNNLVALCRKCHSPTNGKRERAFWTDYYQSKYKIYESTSL